MSEPELFVTHAGRGRELHIDRHGDLGLFVRVVDYADDAGIVLSRRAALQLADALMAWRIQNYGLGDV